MASFSCLISPVILLLISLFFHPSYATPSIDADSGVIDMICKLAESYEFCYSTLSEDPRTPAADLNGLCLISIAITINRVQDTSDRITELLKRVTDPIDKNRLDICQANYTVALAKFQGAYGSSSAKSYWDVINWVRDGANEAINCENVYRRTPPIRESPISGDNHNVVKLAEITFIIVDYLVS